MVYWMYVLCIHTMKMADKKEVWWSSTRWWMHKTHEVDFVYSDVRFQTVIAAKSYKCGRFHLSAGSSRGSRVADQSIESLAVGGLRGCSPPEAVAICD